VPSESFKNLEKGFEAWNQRDVDAVMEVLREDIVWRTGGQLPDIELVYEGHAGVRRFFEQFADPWEEISVQILEVIEDREDQVVLLTSFHARGREGIEVDGRFFHIYRYDERHLCREFWAFAEEDREAAMREAGLDG
jgi:ketosteroid isomerase-like protein